MMKCSQCEEKLLKYIDGNLSEEEKKIVKNHILVCSKCNEAYNKQLLEYEAFKDVFSIDDIKFNNITPKVMNAIDANKYTGIKKSYMKKSANKKYIGAMVAALFLCVFVSPFIMNYINSENENKNVYLNENISELDKDSFIKSIPNEDSKVRDIDKINPENNGVSSNVNYVDVYSKKDMGSNSTIAFNEKYSIYKKGEQFEAILSSDNTNRVIYVKDNLNNIYEFKVKNEESEEIPLFIEWYDNNHLIVVQGSLSKTKVNGSSIIIIDVDTNTQMLIAESKNENIKFKQVDRIEDGLKIYFTEYINGNLNDFREWSKIYEDYQLGDVIYEFN